MDLTTIADVKDFLASYEITWDDNFDSLIGALISAISMQFDPYCNREFELKERTEYHHGGGRYLFVKCPPITEVDSIKGDDLLAWGTGTDITDFVITNVNAGMIANIYGVWDYGQDAIKITYTGGLAYMSEDDVPVPIVPADLKMAATMQVAYAFKRRKDIGLENVSFPDGSIQKMAKDLLFLSEVKAILKHYRLKSIG